MDLVISEGCPSSAFSQSWKIKRKRFKIRLSDCTLALIAAVKFKNDVKNLQVHDQ